MQPSLGLTQARQIADEAVSDAGRLQVRISVAVADEAGALLAFARMDGATRLSARTAVDKTQTVILTGKTTLEFGRGLRADLGDEPELFHGMIARRDLVPFGGGVPLLIAAGWRARSPCPGRPSSRTTRSPSGPHRCCVASGPAGQHRPGWPGTRHPR